MGLTATLDTLNIKLDAVIAKIDQNIAAATGFSTVSVTGRISVGTASTTLLSANTSRLYAHFMNNTLVPVYLQYGSAAVVGAGIKLSPGALLVLSNHELYKGQINAISSTPSILIDILEGT